MLKKLRIFLMIVFTLSLTIFNSRASNINCNKELESTPALVAGNPLLTPSKLFLGAIPFDQLRISHFRPALMAGLRLVQRNIEAIAENPSEPTFENTIEALESAWGPFELPRDVFYNFLSVNTCPALENLAEKINPRLSRLASSVYFNKTLFRRVERVYRQRNDLRLTTEQKTLLENTFLDFVRNGARLNQAEKERLGQINQRLSVLSEKYKQNLNQATSRFQLIVTDRSKLDGLPESALLAAAQRATQQGHPGQWFFTLQAPSYTPFMTYTKDRQLREQMWRAYNSRASSGEWDNRPVLLEIATLRQQRAQLLGYPTHADYVLEDRMAGKLKTVEDFLDRLTNVYKPAAQQELDQLSLFAGHQIEPWDIGFYSELIRNRDYGYNSEDLRAYFPLDQVLEGAFYAANRRYGISFISRTDLPTWDPSVRAFEIQDPTGKPLALFYFDPFPRTSKRPGAWMNDLRPGGSQNGEPRIPHIINVTNLPPPTGHDPSLLTLDHVTTVFHEVGHALHGILSKTRYTSLWGTNVPRDFVELPSQINEYWALVPEVLDVMARHFQTGERIPHELIEKVLRARHFQAGLLGLRQVSFGILDLAWHGRDLTTLSSHHDVAPWEHQALARHRIHPHQPDSLISSSFAHIFSGGYAAGYYGYKWAEVLAADAFDHFEQHGVFDPETARRFLQEILEPGATERPEVLYRRFRGSDPDPQALMRREGLI